MRYLLDTNMVRFAIRGFGRVGEYLQSKSPQEIFVSSITEAELWYGVNKRKSKKLEKSVEAFLKPLEIIDFKKEDAKIFGELYSRLEQKGLSIGMADTMIASVALNNDYALVTDNIKNFKRIKEIHLENWI